MQKFVTVRVRYSFIIGILVPAILFASKMYRSAPTYSSSDGIFLPIIMYHSILKDRARSGKYVVTPNSFEYDLKFLSENGYTSVFINDIIEYVYKGKTLPEKPIILTFDDGYLNNMTYVLPLLEKYNQKAVISVVGEYTQKYSDAPDENPNYAYLSWKNIREMLSSGRIEIQNHSYRMHSLGKRRGTHKMSEEDDSSYRREFISDISKMQTACEKELGIVPSCFTYPFGSISPESQNYLKEMGFSASFSCVEGMNHITEDKECLFLLKRCIRTDTRSIEQILNEI